MTWLLTFYLAMAGNNDDPAIALNNRGLTLMQHGRTQEAARAFEQAEALAGSDLALSMILRNEALAMLRLDNTARASRLAARALRLAESAAGFTDPHLTPILNTLAEIAIGEGRYDEASGWLRRAVEIGEVAGPHYATAVHNSGALAKLQGDSRRAKVLCARAKALRRVGVASYARRD